VLVLVDPGGRWRDEDERQQASAGAHF
jgi:hypothetical protein